MNPKAAWQRFADGPDPRPRQAVQGVVIGFLSAGVAIDLGLILPWHFGRWTVLGCVAIGLLAMLGPVVVRRLYWAGLAALMAAALVLTYTPLPETLVCGLVRDNGPGEADVIVVLSAGAHTQTLSTASQERMLRGLELLHAGWADQIVFTGDPKDRRNRFYELAPAAMERLGIPTTAVVPYEAVEAPVQTTFTEAQSLRTMAAARDWQAVLLVTSPSHTRRAGMLFERAGFTVRVVPSEVSRYDLDEPRTSDRLEIFRDWMYERKAWLFYRWKGRL